MKYKLIIFDLDGTLLNTLDDLADSLNTALAHFSFPKRSLPEVRHFLGNGMQRLVEQSVPDGTSADTTAEVLTVFKQYYKEHCSDRTKPYDGIYELLTALKENGCLMAVVSNKGDFAVQILCEQYFPGVFDAVAGEKAGIRKKPAPDTVNHVLAQLDIDRTDTVYIGDSEVDIETAQNAHMNCLSVDWGFRTREELIQAGATVILSQPSDILSNILAI
ncbi:HAD family hydrolase [Hominifimenecus microfluidus]|uniref:HAD family hydrolase n=1 Tax=Hominifimenecus microfluidus TaxID=2885348 RepID=UPI0032BFB63E